MISKRNLLNFKTVICYICVRFYRTLQVDLKQLEGIRFKMVRDTTTR